jgi:transcriptional regulator with GAF, ATPase, and Fis domain
MYISTRDTPVPTELGYAGFPKLAQQSTTKFLVLRSTLGPDEEKSNFDDCIELLRSFEHTTIEVLHDVHSACARIHEFNVLLIWVSRDTHDMVREVDLRLEQASSSITLPFFVIFSSEQVDYSIYYELAFRKITAFAFPLNKELLRATIDAHLAGGMLGKSLINLRQQLLTSESLEELGQRGLDFLLNSQHTSFTGATVTLVAKDQTLNGEHNSAYQAYRRYFLASRSADLNFDYSPPFKEHLKRIEEDSLIQKVLENRVYILEDIESLRMSDDGRSKLTEEGWDINTPGTRHVNSWVGFTASIGDQPVAVITLDHKNPNAYRSNDPQLLEFIKHFARIFASAVTIYTERKYAISYKAILQDIAEPFAYGQLVKSLVKSIKEVLGCDNCDFFSNEYDAKEHGERLTRVASTRILAEDELTFSWGPNRGIAGKVLFDKTSCLIPNCSEDRAFVRTTETDGGNLSMLAIPVMLTTRLSMQQATGQHPTAENQKPLLLGVIICEKYRSYFFDIFQEKLLNDVSFAVSPIIFRALVLEISRSVISNMVDLISNPSSGDSQLDDICRKALKVGLFKDASIYIFDITSTASTSVTLLSYYSYPVDTYYRDQQSYTSELPPRFRDFLVDIVNEDVSHRHRLNESENDVTVVLRDQDGMPFGLFSLTKAHPMALSLIQQDSLDLLARLITTIVSAKQIISNSKFLEAAHSTYSTAVEKIVKSIDLDGVFFEVAKSACRLVGEYIKQCEERSLRSTNNTVDSLCCVIMLPNTKGQLEVRAVYAPASTELSLVKRESLINDGDNVIRDVLINNIINRPDDKSLYFEFNIVDPDELATELIPEKGGKLNQENSETANEDKLCEADQKKVCVGRLLESTNQIIAVPINLSDGRTGEECGAYRTQYYRQIGIIKLESPLKRSLKEVHSKVLLHLADQIKSLIIKKRLDEKIQSYNNLLGTLYNSRNIITNDTLENMLSRAVLATQSGLGANYEVYVLTASNPRLRFQGPKFSEQDAWPPISTHLFSNLQKISQRVYAEDQPIKLEKEIPLQQPNYRSTQESIASGLCVPFRTKDRKLGVFWVLLKGSANEQDWDDNIRLYTVFANQLATAFSEKEKFEQAKTRSIDNLIQEQARYRKMAEHSARISGRLAYFGSIFGLCIIVISLYFGFVPQANSKVQNQIALTILGTFLGASVTAITQLAFVRSDKANQRIDNYYRNLNRNADLNFLLRAAEGLNPSTAEELRRAAIDDARSWIRES